MLTIDNLSKSFGARTIFDCVSWSMADDGRVGLVGLNGAGKSTLLRMIAGVVEPDSGRITRPQRARIGYLPQDAPEMGGRSVLEEALSGLGEMHALDRRRLELEHTLAEQGTGPAHDSALAELGDVLQGLERHGFYNAESRAEAVLFGLGFHSDDLARDTAEFSGGIRMRIALARLLLQAPEFLMLDEPTNHLDLEARNWLEDYLGGYPGAIVMVSHDRYFLDRVTSRTLEVARADLIEYSGSYTTYLAQREARLALEQAAYDKQREEIEHIEAFISRFRYQASKARLVQSRIKQLAKIERLASPAGAEKPPAIRFPAAARGHRRVFELRAAVKRYGPLAVYDRLDMVVERGARIALVGPNGSGKSTLMKLLAGVEPLSSGERVVGDGVAIGYFAQNLADALDYNNTVSEELGQDARSLTTVEIRSLLGAMLFSGDDADKRVGVLSGGERVRLALAKVLARRNNCLLLDEPTNNLDIVAKDTLLEALRRFPGTVLIVSHDRHILNQLVTEVIEVGRGLAIHYLGNYDEYLQKKAQLEAQALSSARPSTTSTGAPLAHSTAVARPHTLIEGAPSSKPEANDAADTLRSGRNGRAHAVEPATSPAPTSSSRDTTREAQREAARKRAAVQKRRAVLESEIEARETERARLASEMDDPDFYLRRADANELIKRYEQLGKEIETLYADLVAFDSPASAD